LQPLLWDALELAVSRVVVGLVNGRAASDLCMCPFYSGQEMDRCACSGSFCLNPFYDMFMTRLWKGEILDNLPVKRSAAKKDVCLKIFHI